MGNITQTSVNVGTDVGLKALCDEGFVFPNLLFSEWQGVEKRSVGVVHGWAASNQAHQVLDWAKPSADLCRTRRVEKCRTALFDNLLAAGVQYPARSIDCAAIGGVVDVIRTSK